MTDDATDISEQEQLAIATAHYKAHGQYLLDLIGLEKPQIESGAVSAWELAHQGAIDYWMTEYNPKLDAPNLEQVRGYLETFHHLCELEEWEKAGKCFHFPLHETPDKYLFPQLSHWGYNKLQIEYAERLFGKLGVAIDFEVAFSLATSYFVIGDDSNALFYYEKALEIAQIVGNRSDEAFVLRMIGNIYGTMGRKDDEVKCYQQSLEIEQEIRQYSGDINLLDIGECYQNLKNDNAAIQVYHQQLSNLDSIAESKSVLIVLEKLFSIYEQLKDQVKASECLDKMVETSKNIQDNALLGKILEKYGDFYSNSNQHQQAIKCYLTALEEARVNQGFRWICTCLFKLGQAHRALNQDTEAIQFYQEALSISQSVGNSFYEARSLHLLGCTYSKLGQAYSNISLLNEAIDCHTRDFEISRKMASHSGQVNSLLQLSIIYSFLGDRLNLLNTCRTLLAVTRQFKNKDLEEWVVEKIQALEAAPDIQLLSTPEIHWEHPNFADPMSS